MRIALFVLLFALCQEEASEDVAISRKWEGDTSRIDVAEVSRITDAAAWKKLWERHDGKESKVPAVDFTKNMVVATFLGKADYEKIGVYGVKRTKTELVVGVEVEDTDCCDLSPHPLFCMMEMPKSSLKASVILRVRAGTEIDPRKDQLLKEFTSLE